MLKKTFVKFGFLCSFYNYQVLARWALVQSNSTCPCEGSLALQDMLERSCQKIAGSSESGSE